MSPVAGVTRGGGEGRGPAGSHWRLPGRAIGHVMMSLLYPLCTFFLLCLCIAYWASTAVYPPLFLLLLFLASLPTPGGSCSGAKGLPGPV